MAPDLDNEWLTTLLGWADEIRTLGVRANSDEPEDAARARAYGAEGIGLCRTEHMFFDPERLPIVQRMITAPNQAERKEALDEMREFQRADFAGLFEAMDGLPVILRLLDPPLHEFLPSWEELHRHQTDLQLRLVRAADLETVERLVGELSDVREMLVRVEALRETNPMLGLRGVRLGITMPEITRMQARACFEAAVEVAERGGDPRPELMVPLVERRGRAGPPAPAHRRGGRGRVRGRRPTGRVPRGHDDRGPAAPRSPPRRSPSTPTSSPSAPTTSPRPRSPSAATTPSRPSCCSTCRTRS